MSRGEAVACGLGGDEDCDIFYAIVDVKTMTCSSPDSMGVAMTEAKASVLQYMSLVITLYVCIVYGATTLVAGER